MTHRSRYAFDNVRWYRRKGRWYAVPVPAPGDEKVSYDYTASDGTPVKRTYRKRVMPTLRIRLHKAPVPWWARNFPKPNPPEPLPEWRARRAHNPDLRKMKDALSRALQGKERR